MEVSGDGVDYSSTVKYSILQFNVGRERYDVGRVLVFVIYEKLVFLSS